MAKKKTPTKKPARQIATTALDPASVTAFDDLPLLTRLNFVGLIAVDDAGGGGKDGRGNRWTYSVNLQAWKLCGGRIIDQPCLLVCRDISERKLSSLMKSVDRLDIIEFTAERPDPAKRVKTYPHPLRLELIRFGSKSRDRELVAKKAELSKPVIYQDKVFGMMQLDRTMGAFITRASFRGVEVNVSFETTDLDKLKELIRQAKPLWKKRQAWFTNWRKSLWDHYKRVLADNWWNEEEQLTETKFYRHLEWPVGVDFLFKEETNEFGYRLGGWSEELYTDHGVDAFGKTIDEMEVEF